MSSNVNNLDAAFKQRYSAEGIARLTFEDRPFWGLVPKEEIAGADQVTRAFAVPVLFANNAAVGGNFALSQARSALVSSKVNAFQITTSKYYGFVTLDMEAVERSVGNENAFVDLKSLEIDQTIENVSNRLHRNAWNNGDGTIGQVGNSTQMPSFATSVCVLNDLERMVFIQPGDELTVSPSGTPQSGERAFGTNNHGLYVIAVNLDAGTFQVGNVNGTAVNLNDAADGIPTIAALDWLAIRGDRQVPGTVGGTCFAGFQGWIPNAATGIASSGDSFYNVNRYQSVDWLAGTRFDGSNYAIEDALVQGSNILAKKGGTCNAGFINHKHFSALVNSISSRGQVQFLEVSPSEYPTIGYRGVRIIGAKSDIDIIPDYACPGTVAALMNLEDWAFASVGGEDPVRFMNGDGLEFLRQPTSDSIQAYVVNYGALYCRKPRNNANITLAA